MSNDRTEYEAWFARANQICLSLCGLGIDDLADGPSWDAWADEMSPAEYVEERLAEEGFYA